MVSSNFSYIIEFFFDSEGYYLIYRFEYFKLFLGNCGFEYFKFIVRDWVFLFIN